MFFDVRAVDGPGTDHNIGIFCHGDVEEFRQFLDRRREIASVKRT
jgi:hypothetical protein